MKRVLVTGGAGRLGRYVVAELVDDYEVTVIDRTAPGTDVAFVSADILDRSALGAAICRQDAVIHLAAHDADAEASETEFVRTNVEGTWNVFDVARAADVPRFVHCSSVAALNISPENPPQHLPVDPDHVGRPVGAYGLSKLMGEAIARRFAMLGDMSVVCLRPTLVMYDWIVHTIAYHNAKIDGGPEPGSAHDPAWPDWGEALPGSRSFVTARDAARGFRAALECPSEAFSLMFLSAADTYSPLPTRDVVAREFGVTPPLKNATLYRDDPRASIYDIAPTAAALGWRPLETWDDVTRRVLEPSPPRAP